MAEDVRLYLISAKKSRTTGHWPDDDYEVRLGAPDGPDIGRNLWRRRRTERVMVLGHKPRPDSGALAGGSRPSTREEAMAAFKTRWIARPR